MSKWGDKLVARAQARETVARLDVELAKLRSQRAGAAGDRAKQASLDVKIAEARAKRADANRVLRGRRGRG